MTLADPRDGLVAQWGLARAAAQAAAAAKLSHDVRGQLTPILLTAERLQTHADPALRRAGDSIARMVDRTTELVRVGLDSAREAPALLELTPAALGDVLTGAVAAVGAVPIPVEIRGEADAIVEVDRAQMAVVLAHLLENAAQAGARHLTIEMRRVGGVADVLVADDGPGLPESVQAAPFTPFLHCGRHRTGGLGLALARDLMRAHRGDLTVDATGPEGTRFRLTLPAGLTRRP